MASWVGVGGGGGGVGGGGGWGEGVRQRLLPHAAWATAAKYTLAKISLRRE